MRERADGVSAAREPGPWRSLRGSRWLGLFRADVRDAVATKLYAFERGNALRRRRTLPLDVFAYLIGGTAVFGLVLLVSSWLMFASLSPPDSDSYDVARGLRALGITNAGLLGMLVPMGLFLVVALVMAFAAGISAFSSPGKRAAHVSLALTPMPRKTIVLAILLGRTALVRRFLLRASPAAVSFPIGTGVVLAMERHEGVPIWVWLLVAALALMILAGAAVSVHGIAGIGMYLSCRMRHPAAAVALGAVLVFAVPLVGGCNTGMFAPIYYVAMGMALLPRLARNYDAFLASDG